MPLAFILGGSGPIGAAAARRFLDAGWEVAAASRSGALAEDLIEAGVRSCTIDRRVRPQLEQALGDGADVLVDVAAFTVEDATQLNTLSGCLVYVAISSASVYTDAEGRTLDEASNLETFPLFPVPIPEDQPTVAGSEETYSTRKVTLERELLDGPIRTAVIRPAAIHGPGSRLPRELFVVKRILDGRNVVVLVSNGESRFRTTSVANLAELIVLAARAARRWGAELRRPAGADDHGDLSSDRGGARARARDRADSRGRIRAPRSGESVGGSRSVVLDMSRAELDLGYRPVTTYAAAVEETCTWLAGTAHERDWSDTYLEAFFDYAAEDALLATRRETPRASFERAPRAGSR